MENVGQHDYPIPDTILEANKLQLQIVKNLIYGRCLTFHWARSLVLDILCRQATLAGFSLSKT